MLRYLNIRNLAVIERLDVEFEPGLNVLTGETGAGKSIVIQAVNLLLGARASGDLIRTGASTADVQGIFELPGQGEVIVRREITAQGRSRAFIDNALVTTGALKERIGPSIDLHGQHDHQRLLDPAAHLDLLDAFGGLQAARADVTAAYDRWQGARSVHAALLQADRDRSSRMDLLAYQLGEIDRAAPRPGEDEELAASRQILVNADKLARLSRESYSMLYESDQAVMTGLAGVWKRLGELAGLDVRAAPFLEGRDAVMSHLDELAAFLRSYADGIDASPERLQEVENRLAVLERLKKKYGPSLGDVLSTASRLRAELDAMSQTAERIAVTETELGAARDAFFKAARALSTERRRAAVALGRALMAELRELAMERSRFEVRFEDDLPEERWSARGIDAGEFYLSPNPGEELRPLSTIASGGELSRIMLALRSLASTDQPGKTLIFDEVDAGIGGRVAQVVGARLRRLSARHQVICISHLPQIAAHGTVHFRVLKHVRSTRTTTALERLDGEARVQEIARLMAGSVVTPKAVQAARELLAACGRGPDDEDKAKLERTGNQSHTTAASRT